MQDDHRPLDLYGSDGVLLHSAEVAHRPQAGGGEVRSPRCVRILMFSSVHLSDGPRTVKNRVLFVESKKTAKK